MRQKFYQSPPGSNGNDGALPTTWDADWQVFTNLTTPQIAAFQGMPQDLLFYAAHRRWVKEISGTTVKGIPVGTQDRDQAKISQLKQAFDAGALSGVVAFNDAAGKTQMLDADGVTALYYAIISFVQKTYSAFASLKSGIAAKTISSRAQVDAAYENIA